jgi:hypothetical protein
MGDTILNFAHNTNFTDIMWQNKLMVHFTGMNPHDGQMLYLRVVEKTSGMEVYRTMQTVSPEFAVTAMGIETGKSYHVDFFSDHNGNGMYDAPPADHAWRLELNDVMGDAMLNFAHNTNFTDIMWQNKLMVHFTGMNPHDGQMLYLRVVDKASGMEVYRTMQTVSPEFSVAAMGIETGKSYNIDFFSDHNGNGMYDAPPADHAWRLELNDVMGDTTLNFAHNTNFTDIDFTTGVEDLFESEIKIYPNPANSFVNIELNESVNEFTVAIFDITGKTQKIINEFGGGIKRVDLTSLENGIYFVQISGLKVQLTYKLVKR